MIIDETSMVSSVLFYQVNQRSSKIFGNSGNEPFAGLPIIVCGDFFQLPLVKGLPVNSSAALIKGFIALDLWRKFQMVELTKVIRQRGDFEFISPLNKIREGGVGDHVENTMLSHAFLRKNLSPNMLYVCLQKTNQQKNIIKLN